MHMYEYTHIHKYTQIYIHIYTYIFIKPYNQSINIYIIFNNRIMLFLGHIKDTYGLADNFLEVYMNIYIYITYI